MKYTSLILALNMSACGSAPSGNPAATATATTVASKDPEKAAAKDTAITAQDSKDKSDTLSLAVNSIKDLPACDAAHLGQLASIVSNKTFYTCDTTNNWTQVDVKGSDGSNGKDGISVSTTDEPAGANCASGGQKVQSFADANQNGVLDSGETTYGKAKYVCTGASGTAGAAGAAGSAGAAGAAGATGAAGTAGTNGNDNHIATTYTCDGSTTTSTFYDTLTPIRSRYKVQVTSYGDAFALGYVYWNDNAIAGASNQASWSQTTYQTYAKNDASNATSPISVIFNQKPGTSSGVWTYTLNRGAATATATYFDTDMTPNSVSWTLACTVANY